MSSILTRLRHFLRGMDAKLPESEEIIICFESAAEAIMAEQALTENRYAVRVMPVPAQLRAGCGFCLRFFQHDIEKAAAFLVEQGFNVKETYRREESAGSYKRVIIYDE